jgi:glyoxylase-like metal-dependent hydrolase (beta-lactamase superfamily II)/rhodanese-related sulfurtransferase
MYIEQLYTDCLAEAAYYIESDGEVAIIDPLRETEPYTALATKRNSKIKFVFETHFHADFVSGHIDLAKKTGARIVYGPLADTSYKVYNAKDSEEFSIGKIKIRVLHTPGHTPESSCYLLFDEQGKEHAIFTGDTLFVGDVGRPDLLDGVMSQEELAGMLYDSLTKKIKTLPDHVILYPAHGPGSACGKNIGKETVSTIGEQKKYNYALQDMSRENFIRQVTDDILPPPQYFFEDARINKEGYSPIDVVMSKNKIPMSAKQFNDAVAQGALILDTRMPDEFEKGFVPGSINIGLKGQYAVWVGTLLDMKKPLVLVTAKGYEEESILRLARVGFENVLGYLEGGPSAWTGKLETMTSISAPAIAAEVSKGAHVLDVRKPAEWSAGHLKNAAFVPLTHMPDNLAELDKNDTYLVYCGGGYRSMMAISLMRKDGFKHLYNVSGGFGAMQKASMEIANEELPA